MRRSRSPALSYCTASGRDSSDWDVWAVKAGLRLRFGTRYLGLEVSTAARGSVFLFVAAICTRAVMSTTINRGPWHRHIGLVLGAAGVTALLAAALPELTAAGEAVVAAASSPATVEIDNFAFAPAILTVTAGTTVTWKNEDDSPHRIGDQNGTFKSAALDTDDTFSDTFAAPGEYPYICTMHPYMVGKIVVRPAAKMSSN